MECRERDRVVGGPQPKFENWPRRFLGDKNMSKKTLEIILFVAGTILLPYGQSRVVL
jgi:hypothetical protein